MAAVLAPFHVRSFRFQWPADLFTSWAIEMENLILGWFVLSTTGSVEKLVVFGALVWFGSLFSPLFGVLGDRLGFRLLLCATRAGYALLALALTALTFAGALVPWQVFTIAAVAGLLRPQDNVMRYVLVGQTMRPELLMPALGIQRTTSDTARIAGALAGTGGVALIGMGPAYVIVTGMYVAAFLLSLGVAGPPRRAGRESAEAAAARALAGLRQALGYVWGRPDQLGAFSVAFLVNLLAFPFFLGLLPYVAKDVYAVGQSGLGYLAASFACGAFAGSLVLGAGRAPWRAGRAMLAAAALWFVAILAFGQSRAMSVGLALLFACGVAQSFCMTPLAAVMLRSASDEMRGRVMGIRMLAIWGLPLGLLAAGPLIARLGYPAATALYAGSGLAATLAIAWRWRAALWDRAAPANSPFAGERP
ncbi:MAG TPA: MFS transporter [Burkholderiales bacterium]|nr:MFS transporter [Burkholderiales bacterium]